jgi:hypothetical protein
MNLTIQECQEPTASSHSPPTCCPGIAYHHSHHLRLFNLPSPCVCACVCLYVYVCECVCFSVYTCACGMCLCVFESVFYVSLSMSFCVCVCVWVVCVRVGVNSVGSSYHNRPLLIGLFPRSGLITLVPWADTDTAGCTPQKEEETIATPTSFMIWCLS